jgi:lipopolysaccharide heptosyltransferase II
MKLRSFKTIAQHFARLLVALILSLQTALTLAFGEALLRFTGHRRPNPAEESANILVVRLDEIGDMVMCTPFLRALRRRLPSAHITLVVKPGIRPLFEDCPDVDEVLVFPFHYREPSLLRAWTLPPRTLRFAVRYLWHRQYDLAFLPRWDTDYYFATFLAYWSGARRRLGFSEKVTAKKRWANCGFDRLLTDALLDDPLRHETDRPLLLLGAWKPLPLDALPEAADRQEIWIREEDRAFAEALLLAEGIGPEEMLVGIGPSGGHSILKQWPLENFTRLGKRLREKYHARLVLFGGPDETALGAELADQIGLGTINLAGRTSLKQSAALMARCRVYVGNDSGPTHVAAAMGTPVVAIFGSSCPHRFHPGENTTLVWHPLPCSPCRTINHEERCQTCVFDEPRCLTWITVEEVLQAVEERLFSPARRLTEVPSSEESREESL